MNAADKLPDKKRHKDLTLESFDQLLDWLNHDRDLAAERYEQVRSRLIKIFVCRLLFSTSAVGQSCTVDISTNPSSPVPAGQAINVNATVSAGIRQIGGGGLLTASVNYDGASICSSFSDSCFVTIDPGSPGFHSFDWSCMDTNTGDSNFGSQSLEVVTSTPPQRLIPQYFILSLLYNAPGKDSTSGYSNNVSASVTASIEQDIGQGVSFDSSGSPDAFISGVSFAFSTTWETRRH